MSIWDKPISHGELLKRIWRSLELGVNQRKHPFHTAVFATTDGVFPSVRTVILRRFWTSPARIAFHAHTGSPKIDQLGANNSVSWLFYDKNEKIQVRVNGTAQVHVDDEIADEQWDATAMFGRRCYMGVAPTGYSKKPFHGMPDEIVERDPTPEESESGRKHFCVVSSSIDYLDLLELDVRGHRRSFFSWDAAGAVEMGWLTP